MFFLHAFQLTIHISDENDNPPIFSQDIYTKTIPENVPLGYSVIQVNTSDADLGINADHTFTITGMSLSVYIVFKNPEFFVDFSTSSYNNFSIGSSSPWWCSCHTLYVSPRKQDKTLFWEMHPYMQIHHLSLAPSSPQFLATEIIRPQDIFVTASSWIDAHCL